MWIILSRFNISSFMNLTLLEILWIYIVKLTLMRLPRKNDCVRKSFIQNIEIWNSQFTLIKNLKVIFVPHFISLKIKDLPHCWCLIQRKTLMMLFNIIIFLQLDHFKIGSIQARIQPSFRILWIDWGYIHVGLALLLNLFQDSFLVILLFFLKRFYYYINIVLLLLWGEVIVIVKLDVLYQGLPDEGKTCFVLVVDHFMDRFFIISYDFN